MARWVLPVLVGPSTAVTPAPRARRSRSAGGEKEIGINSPAWRRVLVYHNVTLETPVLNMWNESRPNRRLAACSSSFTAIYGAAARVEHQIGCNARFRCVVLAPKTLTRRQITIPWRVKRLPPVDNGDTHGRDPTWVAGVAWSRLCNTLMAPARRPRLLG